MQFSVYLSLRTCYMYFSELKLSHVTISGEVNPLLEKSYMDLTLHQRVWVLKCLCDNSLVRHVFCKHDYKCSLEAVHHLGLFCPLGYLIGRLVFRMSVGRMQLISVSEK